MLYFVNPYLLFLLLLLPVVAVLMIWARIRRRKKLARFGKSSSLAPLMPEASKYMPWVKLTASLLVLGFLVVTLARPRMSNSEGEESGEKTTSRGIEIMICVDVSNSMLASSTNDDNGVSRLDRAKFILEKLVEDMRDDKVGLIVFAGEAYTQMPITSDYVSAKIFVNSLSPDMVPLQGTAIGDAIQMAANSFTPGDKVQRAIVLLTDGENFEDNAEAMAQKAADAGIQVDVIGLGTTKGNHLVLPQGSYMGGRDIVTKLDETTAQAIAKAGKGIYVNGASNNAVAQVNQKLDELAKTEFERRNATKADEQFPVFALVALILLVIDTIIVTRKISWLKRYKFFSK